MKFDLKDSSSTVVSAAILALLIESSTAHQGTIRDIGHASRSIQFQEQLKIHQNYGKEKKDVAPPAILTKDEFLRHHLSSMGVKKESIELAHEFNLSVIGTTVSHYDQFINGVKVFGSRVTVTTGRHGGVIKATGQAVSQSYTAKDLDITPSTSLQESFTAAKIYIVERFGCKNQFEVDILEKEVVFYRANLGTNAVSDDHTLTYHIKGSSVIDVEGKNWGIVFDVFVDAKSGKVVDFISHDPLDDEKKKDEKAAESKSNKSLRGRKLLDDDGGVTNFDDFGTANEIIVYDCENRQSCPSNPSIMWRSSQAGSGGTYAWPTNDDEINKAVGITVQLTRLMRAISNQEWVTYARNSRQLKIYLHINMQNAYYNGLGIYFGQGFVTDDVVSHEWAHGYCDFSSDLIYRDESGALNEANSDQLGEALDIMNSQSTVTAIGTDDLIRMDTPRQFTQSCTTDDWRYMRTEYGGLGPGNDQSRWWMMGEEIDPSIGAIRDMYYPECFGHPGSMDSDDYYCGSSDSGGVHKNSGVGNRLFALMVQGGQRDGMSLPALGMTKTLSLAWNTQNAIGQSTTFQQYAEEIAFQCTSAIGSLFLLPDFNTGASSPDSSPVTQADCDNLEAIIEATKIRYEVDYNSCEIVAPSAAPTAFAPTAAPSGPSARPTVAPTSAPTFTAAPTTFVPIPAFFPAYTASDTSSATQNTENEELFVCPGTTLTFSMCAAGACNGDTYMRLLDASGTEIAVNDDSCGLCSSITMEFSAPCQTYTVKQGCFGSSSCGGTVAIACEGSNCEISPVAAPVTAPVAAPVDSNTCPGGFEFDGSECVLSETFKKIASSSKWRVWVPRQHTKRGLWDINTLEFHSNLDCTETILTDGTAISSGHAGPGWVPEHVFDNNDNTRWGGRDDSNNLLWVGMEFADIKQVRCVSLLDSGPNGVTDLRVQAWETSTSSWQNVMIVNNYQSGQRNTISLEYSANPTINPTALPVPSSCPAFTASNTESANQNTVGCPVTVCPGTQLTFETCNEDRKSCVGDTFLRLTDGSGNELASNDDNCGLCSGVTYEFTAPCQEYILNQGCFEDGTCGGTTAIVTHGPTNPPIVQPTTAPTAAPTTGIPESCPAFTASNTGSASQNTVGCDMFVCPGEVLTIETCNGDGKSCNGDTFLRLLDESGAEVAMNDDGCGFCSQITHEFTSPCQSYALQQGCFDDGSCGGASVVTRLSETDAAIYKNAEKKKMKEINTFLRGSKH